MNKAQNDVAEQKVEISTHDFYFKTPLYREIKNDDLLDNVLQGDVDGINPTRGYDTTYKITSRHLEDYANVQFTVNGGSRQSVAYDEDSENFHFVKLKCKRNSEDCLYFLVYFDDNITVKIGQYPSLADIELIEVNKKYGKVLDKETLKLLKRAIGLVSHGAGAGSLVYLRRIFEGLISQSFAKHRTELGITEADFHKKRMNEKVECLEGYLPTELVEMKPLYGVLSQGVHELTEDECLSYFPVLKLSIELILDRKIEEEAKSKRAKDVKAQLQEVQSRIRSGK